MERLFDTQAASGTVMMPTLSVGLAIVHHLEPLTDARRIAYEAERLAKLQRNSLGIIAQKRQGAGYEVSGEGPTTSPRSIDGSRDGSLDFTAKTSPTPPPSS